MNHIDASPAPAPPQPPPSGSSERMRGRRKTSSRGQNRFVGVRQRPSGRWVAEIKDSLQKVRLWLGTFDTAEDAARAYDDAARALRGANARTNFELPQSASNSGLGGGNSFVSESTEPFSFEEISGTEEADGLIGALRSKLHSKTMRPPPFPLPLHLQVNSLPVQPSFVVANPNQDNNIVNIINPNCGINNGIVNNSKIEVLFDHEHGDHDPGDHNNTNDNNNNNHDHDHHGIGMQWHNNHNCHTCTGSTTAGVMWATESESAAAVAGHHDDDEVIVPVPPCSWGGLGSDSGSGSGSNSNSSSSKMNHVHHVYVQEDHMLFGTPMAVISNNGATGSEGAWSTVSDQHQHQHNIVQSDDDDDNNNNNYNMNWGSGANASWDPLVYVSSVLG
ncbi:hypothetical protein ACSBR1_023800 [Camellia fascicularis]